MSHVSCVFGAVALMREWGRIGQAGQFRLESYDDVILVHSTSVRFGPLMATRPPSNALNLEEHALCRSERSLGPGRPVA